MVALEFKDSKASLTAHRHLRDDVELPPNINKLVQDACYDRGLLTLTTSIYPVLRMIPALIVNEDEVSQMSDILKAAIKEVAQVFERVNV